MKILFITNGHGEDIIAARIIKELGGHDITVMPLVGEGKAFDGTAAELIGPRKKMPSGGFIYQSITNMFRDIFSGLIGNTVEQIKLLRTLKGKFDRVVSVGDIVPIIGAMLTGKKFYFVGCAKSDHYDYSYTPWEKHFLRNHCRLCFPRDMKTFEDLKKAGISCEYAGNPMMDCFEITGDRFGIGNDKTIIALLPGTRDDIKLNMTDLSDVAGALIKRMPTNRLAFVVAAAPGSEISASPSLPDILIAEGKFGDVINSSTIVIGLSGTGNEQAAGLGKPVVSFPGRGVQYTNSFAKRQKQLLGDALSVVERAPDKVAREVVRILEDKNIYAKMSSAGRERMGAAGASRVIAGRIINEDRI